MFGLWSGFIAVFNTTHLIILFAGCLTGLMTGILPGIGAVNGIALMLPFVYAYSLPPESALILLAGIYYGAEYGKGVTSILQKSPVSHVHTTQMNGYALTQRGFAGKALLFSAVSSFIGSLLAVVGFITLKPFLNPIISRFGPAEYVALILFVFILVLFLFGTAFIKNLIGLCIGMTIAIVGLDSATGTLRFAFGLPELYDGIDFIIVVIGLFTLGEALLLIEQTTNTRGIEQKITIGFNHVKAIFKHCWSIIRCSLIGFIIGGLPGTGSSVAGAAAYHIEKHINRKKTDADGADEKGIVAAVSAGNAAAISAFIPLLSLGIPGSATTAVLLGAMLMMSLNPGPMFFIQQTNMIWMLLASMLVGNVMLLFMNGLFIRFFSRMIQIPHWILVPFIVVVSFVGVYVVQHTMLSIAIMLILGIVSYLLRKLDYSIVPVILGYILGEPLEVQLRRALAISGGEVGILFQGFINQLLWICALMVILFRLRQKIRVFR